MGRACSTERKEEYKKNLVEKPEGKRALRRPRRKLDYNIKMDLGEVGCSNIN
jgi:hypothetical protein